MNLDKRQFLKAAMGAALAAPLVGCASSRSNDDPKDAKPLAATKRIGPIGMPPAIGVDERLTRVARAQALMKEHDIDAILLEPGSAMSYFSGISWWRSERLTAVIIPAEGAIGVVTPFFEEPSVRESMTFGDDVRTWHEHENPFDLVRDILRDRGMNRGRIGLEDTVRYFVPNGLSDSMPEFAHVSAQPITRGCRMFKSTNELRLMRAASEVTMIAYEHVSSQIREGMTGNDIKQLMNRTQTELGGRGAWSLILVGPASAYPHGTGVQEPVRRGDIVLMDCGCRVHGYQSDISRTFVLGSASGDQRAVWDQVRRGQQIAFEAAQLGRTAGSVDDAVRSWYESQGYGPGYATPGLSHRTGHGIGMDGHEPVNFVHGEKTRLAPGMCFSNEPGLYDFDRFGVRLEDCLYLTEQGPRWFTVPPDSIDDPLGKMGPEI
ncbi:MAG: M24 family metallopeptidase [Gammaproteobacteria bacterium]